MKNFNMPEIVSPTLEKDEYTRLYEGIKKTVSEEGADRVMQELEIANDLTAEERAEWVERVSTVLEGDFDAPTIRKIRQECCCNENGKLEESAQSFRNIFVSLNYDIHKFVDALNEQGAGWYMEDNLLYTKMFACPCPMLEKTKIDSSLTWCRCTEGYSKRFFSIVFGLSVDAEIIHSMRQGFDECLVKITLPFENR